MTAYNSRSKDVCAVNKLVSTCCSQYPFAHNEHVFILKLSLTLKICMRIMLLNFFKSVIEKVNVTTPAIIVFFFLTFAFGLLQTNRTQNTTSANNGNNLFPI